MKAVLLLAALAGCLAGAEQTDAAAPEVSLASSKAARVEVATLEVSDASLQLDLPGEVGGSADANLAAANGGFIEAVLVEAGDTVTEGQTLVRADTGLYFAQFEQAQAQLAQAVSELERLQALGDLGAPAQVDAASTGVLIAKASVSQARNRLSRSVIKAPFDGVVAAVGVERGEAVGPGAPVVRVVQLDPAVITLSVSDRDVVNLVPGMPVTVQVASRSGLVTGVVSRVSPAADLRTRAFPVEIDVPNAERLLLPGMIARVKVERPVVQDAVVVPQDWLVTRRDARGVFVVVDNIAVWRDVVLGEVVHDKVVVLQGLSEGDAVVVTGHRDLVDGDPLVLTRHGTCCREGRPVFAQAE